MNTEVLRRGELMRINQSKIKRLSSSILCPSRYQKEEITKEIPRKSSEAMDRGNFFEWKLWGTLPKEGGIPVLKGGKKKGSKSVIQERIEDQVDAFPGIMLKHGIKVIRTNYLSEVMYNSNVLFHGTKDALVEYKGKPYILDLKLTADVTSQFGDFPWGNFQTLIMEPDATGIYSHVQTVQQGGKAMDILQAHAYMYLMEMKTNHRWGFLYAVFDYKAKGPEHKIIEIPYSSDSRQQAISRLDGAIYKLDLFERIGFQSIPSEVECGKCKALECPSRFQPQEDQGVQSYQFNRTKFLPMVPAVSQEEEEAPF